MLSPAINELLGKVEGLMRQGVLTPAKHVMEGTLVCITEQTVEGITYHQWYFDQLNADWQKVLRNRKRGERLDKFKIVGVFDIWTPEMPAYVQASKPVES